MELTVQISKQGDEGWKASFEELPAIFYVGATKEEVEERIKQLVHALRSPHISIEDVGPDGDVTLKLSRPGGDGEDRAEFPGFHSAHSSSRARQLVT